MWMVLRCRMAGKALSRSTPGLPETEKVTVNLGFVDLGQIDLLVKEGFYSNRTDCIRSAIRQLVQGHGDALRSAVARNDVTLGLRTYSRQELERLQASGQTIHIDGVSIR